MRISWLSNAPWSSTGYGNQTRTFTPRLKNLLGHEVSIQSFYGLEGGILGWQGMSVLPGFQHDYGQSGMRLHSERAKADISIGLLDAWVCRPELYNPPELFAADPNAYRVNWVPWAPIDHEPAPPPVIEQLRKAYRPIAYSRFGERMMQDAGLDCRYVPHGIDTQVFSPGDRRAARERLGFPQDRYMIGMVAANKGVPSRKALTQHLEAFQAFHAKHPDSFLYLHTLPAGGGEAVNLPEYIQHLGLADCTGFPDTYQYLTGLPDQYMADVYRALDVLASVSLGEGFGIPILEAQACGTPVIVGDWTSMSELKWHGWAVDKADALPIWTPMAAYQWIPRPEAILERLEAAYNWRGGTPERLTDVIATYDADWITRTYWKPVLDEIASDLGLPATVEPSKRLVLPVNGTVPPGIDGLNRTQRRQLARVK